MLSPAPTTQVVGDRIEGEMPFDSRMLLGQMSGTGHRPVIEPNLPPSDSISRRMPNEQLWRTILAPLGEATYFVNIPMFGQIRRGATQSATPPNRKEAFEISSLSAGRFVFVSASTDSETGAPVKLNENDTPLIDFFSALQASQQRLGIEFEHVLFDNL